MMAARTKFDFLPSTWIVNMPYFRIRKTNDLCVTSGHTMQCLGRQESKRSHSAATGRGTEEEHVVTTSMISSIHRYSIHLISYDYAQNVACVREEG